MGDDEVPQPHPGLVEAERRVRAAIEQARADGTSAVLAVRYAELGMILAAQNRHRAAVDEYQNSLGQIKMLQVEGAHEQQRMLRITSLSAPPPAASDIDLGRLEVEVRVALVEAFTASGDLVQAREAWKRAQPMTKGLFRRRLRKRLDRAAGIIAAGPDTSVDTAEVQRHLARTADPAQQRVLRLRLANGYLDSGDLDSAVRESLLLVQAADAANDPVVRAGARQVLGLALEGQGRASEALPILSDAFHDLHRHGDTAGMIGMAEALAHRLLDSGDAAGAATVLRTAHRAAADTGDDAAELATGTMLGVVLDESGDRSGAIGTLTDTATRAQRLGRSLARADALHSTAVALGHSPLPDDLVEALSVLQEAKRIYTEHGKPERVAGCDHEAAALLGRHGSFDAAQARYAAALQAYEQLPIELRDTGAWPDEMADCRANLTWLASERLTAPNGLFRSGGHSMSHTEA